MALLGHLLFLDIIFLRDALLLLIASLSLQWGSVSVHISSVLLCYHLLRTVYCIYSSTQAYRIYRPTRYDYYTSLKRCLLALRSQLLLSLKLLPHLHSCRSPIVRVKRYSYRFVRHSSSRSTQCTFIVRRSFVRHLVPTHHPFLSRHRCTNSTPW
jgi:hypothetical protein